MLALIAGIRLVVIRQPIDWLTVGLVVVAAVAAIAHRNAVAGLESRGRGEAESFARILRGLSRSVSADAIVAAILDDLIDATAADHVVLVRRRPDAATLEATLVTRRQGVPTTTTMLPVSLLDPTREAWRWTPSASRGARPARHGAALGRPWQSLSPAERIRIVAPQAAEAGAAPATKRLWTPTHPRTPTRPSPQLQTPASSSRWRSSPTSRWRRSCPACRGRPPRDRHRRRPHAPPTHRGRVARAAAGHRACRRRTCSAPGAGRSASEVLARGDEAEVVERVAGRVQSAFGLSHTLTAPLRSEARRPRRDRPLAARDRDAWPESARRLVRGAASETAAALARADSYREATAGASTDPLTGLPNRRYFDEFAALLARRPPRGRRASPS